MVTLFVQKGVNMKRLLIAGAAALALFGSSAAMARVDVGIAIGIPGVVIGGPAYYAPPPPVYVAPPVVYGPPPVAYVEPPFVVVGPGRHYYRRGWEHRGPRFYRDGYRDQWRGRGQGHRHGHDR